MLRSKSICSPNPCHILVPLNMAKIYEIFIKYLVFWRFLWTIFMLSKPPQTFKSRTELRNDINDKAKSENAILLGTDPPYARADNRIPSNLLTVYFLWVCPFPNFKSVPFKHQELKLKYVWSPLLFHFSNSSYNFFF